MKRSGSAPKVKKVRDKDEDIAYLEDIILQRDETIKELKKQLEATKNPYAYLTERLSTPIRNTAPLYPENTPTESADELFGIPNTPAWQSGTLTAYSGDVTASQLAGQSISFSNGTTLHSSPSVPEDRVYGIPQATGNYNYVTSPGAFEQASAYLTSNLAQSQASHDLHIAAHSEMTSLLTRIAND